jgi:hypothetical protein
MRFIAAAIWSLGVFAAPPDDSSIRLQPFEDHRVLIFHDGLAAEWQIRMPEVVAASEGTFLTSPRTRMIWSKDSQGRWGYDWQTTEEYAASAYKQIGGRLTMIVGMEISPRMKVTPDRIDLTLRLRNVSARAFHNVTADGGCLQHRTERFFDDAHNRTFILTEQGVTSLDRLDRTIPIRTKYFFDARWFEDPATRAMEYFWGRSNTRPAAPWIASRAATGSGAIGIAWEHCIGVRQNSDPSHRCMHSSPCFGDMQPGEAITRRGIILFGATVEELAERFQEEGLSIHAASEHSHVQ